MRKVNSVLLPDCLLYRFWLPVGIQDILELSCSPLLIRENLIFFGKLIFRVLYNHKMEMDR